ncbi:MAG: hypothetical protein C4551_02455 [Bacillota bacterium]|nr:MAG: hypothetical protein C4551_02455 [Bacillota bacterium]
MTDIVRADGGERFGRRDADGTPLCEICGARMVPMTAAHVARMWPDLALRGEPSGVCICPRDLAAAPEPEDIEHEFAQDALAFDPARLCTRGRAVYVSHIRAVFWEDVREKTLTFRERTREMMERLPPAGPVRCYGRDGR